MLSGGQLDGALAQATAEWRAAGADVAGISAGVGDLGGLTLGSTSGSHITVDPDAAGWGWDVNHPGDPAGQHMDLLTVVRHEVGHALGLDHTAAGLMSETLSPGETRSVASAPELPAAQQEPPADDTATGPTDTTDTQGTATATGTEVGLRPLFDRRSDAVDVDSAHSQGAHVGEL